MSTWRDQIEAALAVRDFARADAVLSDWLARAPQDAAAQFMRSERLATEGRHAEALDACEHGLSLDPKMTVLHAVRADRLRSLGRLDEAEAALATALAHSPTMPRALGAACRIAQARKDDDLLKPRAERLLAAFPHLSVGHLLLGGVALRARDMETAEDHARRALALAPEDWEGHHLLGHVLLQRDRPAEALEAAYRARTLAPADQGVRRLVKKAEVSTRTSRKLDWLARLFCGFGLGPPLAIVIATFAVIAAVMAQLDPQEDEILRKLVFFCGFGAMCMIFVAIEHHLKRAKPDPKTIRLDPDY